MTEPALFSLCVADVLKEHMHRQGLSGYRLIKLTGMQETRVYRWMRGQYAIDLDDLAAVALILDISVTSVIAEAERLHRAGLEASGELERSDAPGSELRAERDAWDAEQAARRASDAP